MKLQEAQKALSNAANRLCENAKSSDNILVQYSCVATSIECLRASQALVEGDFEDDG